MPGLLFALLLAVQSPQQPPPAPPVYRTGVSVVQVDATVHDKHGRLVEGLKPEDFEVREDGRPQKIELFYSVSGARTPSGPQPGRFPRIFVAVFDDEHLTPGGFNRVRDAAIDLFSRDFRPGDIGGVIAAGRMVNDRLSTDRAELLAALHSVRPNAAAASRFAELMAYGSNVNPDGAGEMAGQVAVAEWLDSGTRTSYVLQSLLSKLAPIEGRKIVLLLTEGFPSDHELTERTIDLATRANARIYPLDARGLGPATHDVLNELAVETGGVLVERTNHFQAAVARIAEEAGTYYVLGYRPTKAPDGTFRKISVGVDRADLVVSARRGTWPQSGPHPRRRRPLWRESQPRPRPYSSRGRHRKARRHPRTSAPPKRSQSRRHARRRLRTRSGCGPMPTRT